ncbi:SGT1-domain-containing protein [Camillea tinctor]|nr:SGT1-domain-containing protein [Camillea tinctor]
MDSEDRTEFFQDGFQGFPRTLPDNCVEYILFIIDSKLDARTLLTELENVRKAAVQLCSRIASEYIWQRDSFQLQVKRDGDLVYLHGTTDYGDSIEDEWLVVYLLRELTQSFPNLWVRVFDSDGEFLLVEAANVLPKWLSPEIDSNRDWIHQGSLQILPLSASSGEKRPLSLREAIGHIRSNPGSLLHSTFIEAESFYRLEKYPAQITDSLHHSMATIPRKLAYLLHKQPTAIAPAVEAFYLRDPIAMKPLASLSGTLKFPPNDLVTVSVKFTKVLFAQLRSQRFVPPPIWTDLIEAAEKQAADAEGGRINQARLEMGMKVTSGFEMLAASVYKKDNRLAREFAIALEDLEEDLKEDGDQVLPSNKDVEGWSGANRDDDESWLDINFEDFENELQGRQGVGVKKGPKVGFGDSSAQADLRKIVSRFEAFLNDEKAGMDGAEMEDMDHDDDVSDGDEDEDDSEDDSEDEDKAVSFDEEQFSRMMREMMGLPPEEPKNSKVPSPRGLPKPNNAIAETEGGLGDQNDSDDSDDDIQDIQKLSAQMEAELKKLGALRLDSQPKAQKALETKEALQVKGKGKASQEAGDGNNEEEEDSGEEVDIDYNLAKNLLESFKSQAGLAGPASNILGMMGIQLPRDEDEEGEEGEGEGEEEGEEEGEGKVKESNLPNRPKLNQ